MTISVMVVDDSVVIRRLVSKVLDEDPDITVVGTAVNGKVALSKLNQLAPDIVTLDIEMPELDGLATLRELRKTHPRLPVIMFSTLTERAAKATLEALALGANDYVAKPANVGSVALGMESVRNQLIPKIKSLCASRLPVTPRMPAAVVPLQSATAPRPAPAPAPTAVSTATPRVLGIGCSTGGPEALTAVLKALPGDLPVPVVVVQHMPPVFTAMFAQRLDAHCALRVREAQDGDVLEPGLVLLAPGDHHMTVVTVGGRQQVKLDQSPPQSWCRPAVDPLFRALAEVYGGATLAVVLTGMGQDGLRGAERLREVGAPVVVQDEATSVVWGMPGAIATARLATRVLPLSQVAGEILAALAPLRRPAPLAAARR
jgi:two-component system chemotaxis response regulator CheB